jgi:flavin-dependent dehydrogenase
MRIYSGFEVTGLLADENNKRVTAVKLRSRKDRTQPETIISAELVVDASGRHSKAPDWLAELGQPAPEEWTISPKVGYATRVYKQPVSFSGSWKTMYVHPTAPTGTRGGIIIPMEHGRWQVTLIGVSGDYPPTTDDAFLDFARSLPTPRFYEVIKDAEPEGKICGFRTASNSVRR